MKQFWKEISFCILLGVFVPFMIVGVALEKQNIESRSMGVIPTEETRKETDERTYIHVIMQDGTQVLMELEEYIIGVLLQEMPADFELEAKKAQTVVARTYTLRHTTRSTKHAQGAICTSPSCCQAYISPADFLNAGGTQTAVDQAADAVKQTAGKVLLYEGALIEATYFSCSGGRTEDAAAVWGQDVPYLRAVDSPGEEGADHYMDTVIFTASDFADAMGIPLSGPVETWFGPVSYTEGGGVETMVIGGLSYSGTQLRQKLGLRSTSFEITAELDTIQITTRGYGHRVGMSQYGADAMAVLGSDYPAILEHYYPGTELTDWIDKDADLG